MKPSRSCSEGAAFDIISQAEAADTLKAKEELRSLLLSNETNKAIKEKQRQEEQALDRKYAREYTEKLEMEDKVSQQHGQLPCVC